MNIKMNVSYVDSASNDSLQLLVLVCRIRCNLSGSMRKHAFDPRVARDLDFQVHQNVLFIFIALSIPRRQIDVINAKTEQGLALPDLSRKERFKAAVVISSLMPSLHALARLIGYTAIFANPIV